MSGATKQRDDLVLASVVLPIGERLGWPCLAGSDRSTAGRDATKNSSPASTPASGRKRSNRSENHAGPLNWGSADRTAAVGGERSSPSGVRRALPPRSPAARLARPRRAAAHVPGCRGRATRGRVGSESAPGRAHCRLRAACSSCCLSCFTSTLWSSVSPQGASAASTATIRRRSSRLSATSEVLLTTARSSFTASWSPSSMLASSSTLSVRTGEPERITLRLGSTTSAQTWNASSERVMVFLLSLDRRGGREWSGRRKSRLLTPSVRPGGCRSRSRSRQVSWRGTRHRTARTPLPTSRSRQGPTRKSSYCRIGLYPVCAVNLRADVRSPASSAPRRRPAARRSRS